MKYVAATNIALSAIVIASYGATGNLDASWGIAVTGCLALAVTTARRIGFSHMPLNRPWLLLLPIGLALAAESLLLIGAARQARWMAIALAYIAGNHIAYLRQRLSA